MNKIASYYHFLDYRIKFKFYLKENKNQVFCVIKKDTD